MSTETTDPDTDARIDSLCRQLTERGVGAIDVACVLGSGLGAFAERLDDPVRISYDDIDGLPGSTVPGHAGELVYGSLRSAGDSEAATRVLLQAGRVHRYEGHSAAEITLAVRAMARLGTRVLVLTNAAGGLRKNLAPGTLMRLTDHVNRQGATPLSAGERGSAEVYDAELGGIVDDVAKRAELELERGIYVGLPGPSYESPAEVRFLGELCGDAVGMSTVLEAIAARASGMRVVGLSCITNFAAGLSDSPPDHAEVIEVGRRAAVDFGRLLELALPQLAAVAS